MSRREYSHTSIVNSRILIVDDHRNIRVSLNLTLQNEGAKVAEAATFTAAVRAIEFDENDIASFPFDIILLDIRLPDGSGLDILRRMASFNLASRVIMISGEGTVSEAFEATQIGAFDYIEKPFPPERVLVSVRRCLDFNHIQLTNLKLRRQILKGQEMLGEHESMQVIHKTIKQVGPSMGRILILGESGTGKELVAKAIHRESTRHDQQMIKVNCAAIPHSLVESELFGHEKGAFTGAIKARKGVFEQADGGTLFLDEIGELSLDIQAKLLRVLQNGEISRIGSEKSIKVDVRLITATNRDLEGMVQNNEFREDLFYRLNVISILIPPLRERKSDIPRLAQYFLEEACERNSLGTRFFSERVMEQICDYDWPGNVRELINLVERLSILSEENEIDGDLRLAADQRSSVSNKTEKDETREEDAEIFSFTTGVASWQEFHQSVDRKYLSFVLEKSGGNVSEAARILCLERAYLHRLMKKLGIQRGVVVNET